MLGCHQWPVLGAGRKGPGGACSACGSVAGVDHTGVGIPFRNPWLRRARRTGRHQRLSQRGRPSCKSGKPAGPPTRQHSVTPAWAGPAHPGPPEPSSPHEDRPPQSQLPATKVSPNLPQTALRLQHPRPRGRRGHLGSGRHCLRPRPALRSSCCPSQCSLALPQGPRLPKDQASELSILLASARLASA